MMEPGSSCWPSFSHAICPLDRSSWNTSQTTNNQTRGHMSHVLMDAHEESGQRCKGKQKATLSEATAEEDRKPCSPAAGGRRVTWATRGLEDLRAASSHHAGFVLVIDFTCLQLEMTGSGLCLLNNPQGHMTSKSSRVLQSPAQYRPE